MYSTQRSNHNFSDLYDRHRERLLNSMTAIIRNRESAEDITAAAFAAAFEKLQTFRGESSFYTWVHSIALNEARKRWRRNPMVSLDSIDGHHRTEVAEPDILVDTLERSECCSRLRKVLRDIPTVNRQILVNHFVRGYSVKKMSRQHGVPVGTVLSRLFTAKRLLRAAWEA